MEGVSRKQAIRKAHYRHLVAILLLSLLVTPVAIYSGESETASEDTNAHISAELANALNMMESDSLISVIVEFPDETSTNEMVERIQLVGLESVHVRHAFHLIPMVSLSIRSDEVKALAEVPFIEEIYLNQELQLLDEPVLHEDYLLAENEDGYVHFDSIVGADLMWAEGYNGSGVTIAVLDSGVWGDHPDLQDSLIGFKDLINGRDDMNPADGIEAYDDNGHGTASAWNAVGDGTASGGTLKGIAPGADLLAIKVLRASGGGKSDIIAQGIEIAVEQGVDIISLSVQGRCVECDNPIIMAIEKAISAGISVVLAAGNKGPAAQTINDPGYYEEPITTGASYGDSGVAVFSGAGPILRTSSSPLGYAAKPDVVTPGYLVVSGRGYGVDPYVNPVYNSSQFGENYTLFIGTSASTPIVAGLIALLMQKHPALTHIEAKTSLMRTATDLGEDPMSQGWGLANVSRASQLLSTSSRNITLMTPRSLPTLPWTSRVLIVGDDRPPQNVTVISTQSVGLVNITISGNASQFMETNTDHMLIPAGYSYFEVKLSVPEDVPLSVVGVYMGHLNLMQETDVIASIEILYSITLFNGRMIFDMEHHSSGTDGDVDDPSDYGYFTGLLRERGMIVSEFGDAEDLERSIINMSCISSGDVFTIADTETSYSEDEVTALHSFVEYGGTLLVFSEFFDNFTGEATFAIDDYNVILEPFGIQCEEHSIGCDIYGCGLVYGTDYGGYVEDDPLMDGVNNLFLIQASTLHVNPSVSNARGLFWKDTERTHAIVARAEYGQGQVFVISDGSILYDSTSTTSFWESADNLRFLRNLATAIIPEAPRVFDVELNIGEFGQEANVTAYIFDDDLEIVTMSVIGPSGENLTGTIVEELGYKFSTSFILKRGGFFSIQVEARDSSGNVKLFQNTILVPDAAADDVVVLVVIYSFLGVAGIGLGYFILTRIRDRPKPP